MEINPSPPPPTHLRLRQRRVKNNTGCDIAVDFRTEIKECYADLDADDAEDEADFKVEGATQVNGWNITAWKYKEERQRGFLHAKKGILVLHAHTQSSYPQSSLHLFFTFTRRPVCWSVHRSVAPAIG